MRLVCPNCAAQYEVNDSAIPDDGRDVQCANCGNTWFQGQPNAHQDAEVAQTDAPQSEDRTAPNHMAPDYTAPDHRAPTATPRPTDPSVFDILRREAEHEINARNSDKEAALREGAGVTDDPDEPQPPEEISTQQQDSSEIETILAQEITAASDGLAGDSSPEEYPADDAKPEPETGTGTEPEHEIGGPEQDKSLQDELPQETFANRARAGRSRLRANRADIERAHLQRQQNSTPDAMGAPELQEIAPVAHPPASGADIEDGDNNLSSLPEIKELQASLLIAKEKSHAALPDKLGSAHPQRKGNRTGFFLAILIALVLVAAYVLKAQIIASAPQAEPYLNQYTALVDVARRGLATGIDTIVGLARDLLAKYL